MRRRSPDRLAWLGATALTLLPHSLFAASFTAFGPRDYIRQTGAPRVETVTFTILNPRTTYEIRILNGGLDGRFDRVSRAVITLNGQAILGPSDFNQNVELIERPIRLSRTNELAVELRSRPGSEITILIIGEDNDPPRITARLSVEPNPAGWHNTDVTVFFECTDATSGIASCPDPAPVTAEGAGQVVSGTAVDRAGNTSTTSVTLNIDKTPPTLSTAVMPPPNPAGWNRTDATVTFNATDALSGVASVSPPVLVASEGPILQATRYLSLMRCQTRRLRRLSRGRAASKRRPRHVDFHPSKDAPRLF